MSELSENHKGRIRELWEKTPEYCSYIEAQISVRIPPVDIIVALMEATGKDFQELALEEWDNERILNEIRNSEYLSRFPAIQEEVVVEESIIPDNVIRGIYEEQVKFKGERWVVHKNDADPFPSNPNPHAHNYESGLKLHLGNGELYDGTKLEGSIPCKKLKELRGLFTRTTMPQLEC